MDMTGPVSCVYEWSIIFKTDFECDGDFYIEGKDKVLKSFLISVRIISTGEFSPEAFEGLKTKLL